MFVLENAFLSPMNQDWVMRGKIAFSTMPTIIQVTGAVAKEALVCIGLVGAKRVFPVFGEPEPIIKKIEVPSSTKD